jgi:hypothetical protein
MKYKTLKRIPVYNDLVSYIIEVLLPRNNRGKLKYVITLVNEKDDLRDIFISESYTEIVSKKKQWIYEIETENKIL